MINAPCWRAESRAAALTTARMVACMAWDGRFVWRRKTRPRTCPPNPFQPAADFRGKDDRDGEKQRGQSSLDQPGKSWQVNQAGQQAEQND